MGKEWLWWLGEFGLAATVAIVAGFVTRDVPISILYGLFVGTVFFVLRHFSLVASRFQKEVDELEDKALNLPTSSHKEDIDPFFKQVARHSRDEAIRLGREITNGKFYIQSRSLANIILEYFRQARPGERIFVTNYGGVMFDSPQGEIVRQMNFDLAKEGADITRVFIETSNAKPEEKKRIREEMERQKGHLNVRYTKETRLPPEARRNIVMIGDRYVAYGNYVKSIIPNRQIVDECWFYTNRDEIEKGKQLAETIIKLSEEYK